MPAELITIAEAIRAQLLALAPDTARATIETLPPVAVLGGVGVVVLILLWILFAGLGALFGGGRRRREAEEGAEYRASEPRREERREPLRDDRRAEPARAVAPADLAARHEELMTRGDRQAQGNDFQSALASFKEALDVARQLAFARPDAPEPQRFVAKALHKVGDVSARLGDTHAARQHHEQALVLLRRVYGANPRDAAIAREFAVTLERLGAAAAQAGDRAGARAAFEEELRIAAAMAQQESHDLAWVRFKAVVHIMLGNLNDPDSRAHYEQARQLFETLERASQIQPQDAQTLQQLRGVLSA
jgi:tetratricopeptide (TPR) repeat protein